MIKSIVVARKTSDFRACGATVPPDSVITYCARCRAEVAVSRESPRQYPAAMVLCNSCALAVGPQLRIDAFTTSGRLQAQQAKSQEMKRRTDEFIRKVTGK